jgi:hypothetical protein
MDAAVVWSRHSYYSKITGLFYHIWDQHEELCELCRTAHYKKTNKAAWNKVERWLNKNKGERKLFLKKNVTYQNEEYGFTALHWLVASDFKVAPQPVAKLIEKVLQMSPNSARVKNDWGSLPLHDVSKASPDVVQMLIEAYPEALQIKDDEGSLPLHTVCMGDASTDVVKMIFEAYPKAIEIRDNYGDLPLHYACRRAAFPVVKMIYDAYPEAAEVHNINEQLPHHVASTF